MCHPVALASTPQHPDCKKSQRHGGQSVKMATRWTKVQWLAGKGLKRSPCTYKVVETKPDGTDKVYGWTDDITYAMAFKLGLYQALAFKADVIEE